MSLQTLYTYHNSFQAQVARQQIEDSGIPAYVFDDNTHSINPDLSFAIGGIKLKVASRDIKKAGKILRLESRTQLPENCPFCQSKNVSFNTIAVKKGFFSIIFALISFSFAAATVNNRSHYKCNDCKEKF